MTTVAHAAAELDLHPSTIRRWVAEGYIHAWRVGRKRLAVDMDEVRRVMLTPVPAAPNPDKADEL